MELCALPTRKLLPLINQLASRLNKGAAADRFQHGLRHILRYAGAAHVHTVLPHLLALANGDRFALHEARVGLGAEKILGARELLATLSSGDSKAARVRQQASSSTSICKSHGCPPEVLQAGGGTCEGQAERD